jgi:hypothetical protein
MPPRAVPRRVRGGQREGGTPSDHRFNDRRVVSDPSRAVESVDQATPVGISDHGHARSTYSSCDTLVVLKSEAQFTINNLDDRSEQCQLTSSWETCRDNGTWTTLMFVGAITSDVTRPSLFHTGVVQLL